MKKRLAYAAHHGLDSAMDVTTFGRMVLAHRLCFAG